MMFTVIVTGSRTWKWKSAIYGVLDIVAVDAGWNLIVVRHGNNPQGADWWAHRWRVDRGLREDQEDAMPADWGRYGKRAGHIRNEEMVAKGADRCVSFLDWCRKPGCIAHRNLPHRSHGGSDCARLAERAGIETWRYYTPE